MKIKVIASGSKGNCTYIECGNNKFLIDIGITFLHLKKELIDISVDVSDLDFIILTHVHSDHIKGLKTLLSKTKIKLYAPEDILEEIKESTLLSSFSIVCEEFCYKGINIKLFPLSHDVPCYGFIINFDNAKLVYITDTGYLNKRYFYMLTNCDAYIIESNHDEKMLMNGKYPYILKQRVVGDKGHLSNIMTANILKKIIGPKTKYILLAHLSEENNTKKLAYDEVISSLSESKFNASNLIITDQYLSTEMVEI